VLITLGTVFIVLITSLMVSFSNDELQKLLKSDAVKTPLNHSGNLSMRFQNPCIIEMMEDSDL
jgi:hypothetical protein